MNVYQQYESLKLTAMDGKDRPARNACRELFSLLSAKSNKDTYNNEFQIRTYGFGELVIDKQAKAAPWKFADH